MIDICVEKWCVNDYLRWFLFEPVLYINCLISSESYPYCVRNIYACRASLIPSKACIRLTTFLEVKHAFLSIIYRSGNGMMNLVTFVPLSKDYSTFNIIRITSMRKMPRSTDQKIVYTMDYIAIIERRFSAEELE